MFSVSEKAYTNLNRPLPVFWKQVHLFISNTVQTYFKGRERNVTGSPK